MFSWQRKHLDQYLTTNKLPEKGFDTGGRGVCDLAGPGCVNIYGTNQSGTNLGTMCGTSIAAPYLAGILAVIEWYRQKLGLPNGIGCLHPILYNQEYADRLWNQTYRILGTNTNYHFPGFHTTCQQNSLNRWDPVQGLGLINVSELIKIMTK